MKFSRIVTKIGNVQIWFDGEEEDEEGNYFLVLTGNQRLFGFFTWVGAMRVAAFINSKGI